MKRAVYGFQKKRYSNNFAAGLSRGHYHIDLPRIILRAGGHPGTWLSRARTINVRIKTDHFDRAAEGPRSIGPEWALLAEVPIPNRSFHPFVRA